MSAIDKKANELRETREMQAELGEIELDVLGNFTLADAMREGSTVTVQAYNWGDGSENACGMTAAVLSAKSRGYM
jgi:hypothetical protein